MMQCVGSVETWTKTPKMTKSSLTAQRHPQYPPGVAAGRFQGGTLFAGMNVRVPVQCAQRTNWRSMRVLATVDLWLLVQGAPLPAAMPMCLLRTSSRAACWMSAWAVKSKTYYASHWLPMLLPARLLASKSRTGGLRLTVVSGGDQSKGWAGSTPTLWVFLLAAVCRCLLAVSVCPLFIISVCLSRHLLYFVSASLPDCITASGSLPVPFCLC